MTFGSKSSRKKLPSSPSTLSTTSNLSEALELPTAPNKPSTNLLDYSICLYGEKGIGKSSLAAQFEDVVLHEMWEPSRRDLRIPIIPQRGESPLTWPRHKAYLQKLLESGGKPGRLAVDTLDLCARACQGYHAALSGVPSLNGLKDNGRAWDGMKCDWENTWSEFLWAGWRITVLSHARVRPKVVRGISRDDMKEALAEGVIIPETQPTCTGWAYEWTKSVCALAFYFGWRGKERTLTIRGDERIYASSGGIADEHFLTPGKNGAPYDAIPMGRSPTVAYTNLKNAWANALASGLTNTEVSLEPAPE